MRASERSIETERARESERARAKLEERERERESTCELEVLNTCDVLVLNTGLHAALSSESTRRGKSHRSNAVRVDMGVLGKWDDVTDEVCADEYCSPCFFFQKRRYADREIFKSCRRAWGLGFRAEVLWIKVHGKYDVHGNPCGACV